MVDACDPSGAGRNAAILGPGAALVIDLPRETEAVRVGITALSGQDAVLLMTASATGAERIALLRAGLLAYFMTKAGQARTRERLLADGTDNTPVTATAAS